MNFIIISLEVTIFILISPFLSGFVAKLKNNLRMRKGQSIIQPYYNLVKLFSKTEVISETASWIFRVTPFVVIASMLTACLLVQGLIRPGVVRVGDLFALIFVFALGRFFLALAALDTASAFGGMGSSREMFISSLVEPAICLVIFAISLKSGSTDIGALSGPGIMPLSYLVAAISLFLIILAETSRIPVDNQETHLELTMIHEAMVLEYSGKSLAILEMAAYLKQLIWFLILAQIIFPMALPVNYNFVQLVSWAFWYLSRLMIIAVSVAFVEVSLAKLRLFRVADFLGFAFVLAVIAIVCSTLGF